jgi:hypothetical protein
MITLALYKGKGRIGNTAIRWWTGSIYSHCELVIDNVCYSSSVMDGGVRSKRVGKSDDQISLGEEHWDLIQLPWADTARALQHFEKTQYNPYGWVQLLSSQIFNRNTGSDKGDFCSNWCAEALGLPSPLIYSPETLWQLVVFINSQ